MWWVWLGKFDLVDLAWFVLLEVAFKFEASFVFVKLQVLGIRLGVDFTFTLDNNDNNDNDNNDNNDNNNPHLIFLK